MEQQAATDRADKKEHAHDKDLQAAKDYLNQYYDELGVPHPDPSGVNPKKNEGENKYHGTGNEPFDNHP